MLASDILNGILGRADMTADPIHPNGLGYELMAARLEPALRAMLGFN